MAEELNTNNDSNVVQADSNNSNTTDSVNNNSSDNNTTAKREYRNNRRAKKKVCLFCKDSSLHIDYKEYYKLRRFLSERSKILPRRATGTCAKHQRLLTKEIKRARYLALLPYTSD